MSLSTIQSAQGLATAGRARASSLRRKHQLLDLLYAVPDLCVGTTMPIPESRNTLNGYQAKKLQHSGTLGV